MHDALDWKKDLQDDPDYLSLSPEEKDKIIRMMEKMMEMGIRGGLWGRGSGGSRGLGKLS